MNLQTSHARSLLVMATMAICLLLSPLCFSQQSTAINPHALSDAVLQGDVARVKQLIDAGVDVQVLDNRSNPNGRYPLNWAAWQGELEIINLLLDAGAEVSKPNRTGFTPLHHAVESGAGAAAELLVKRGADLKAVNSAGMTPLQFAEFKGDSEIAAMLRKAESQ